MYENIFYTYFVIEYIERKLNNYKCIMKLK